MFPKGHETVAVVTVEHVGHDQDRCLCRDDARPQNLGARTDMGQRRLGLARAVGAGDLPLQAQYRVEQQGNGGTGLIQPSGLVQDGLGIAQHRKRQLEALHDGQVRLRRRPRDRQDMGFRLAKFLGETGKAFQLDQCILGRSRNVYGLWPAVDPVVVKREWLAPDIEEREVVKTLPGCQWPLLGGGIAHQHGHNTSRPQSPADDCARALYGSTGLSPLAELPGKLNSRQAIPANRRSRAVRGRSAATTVWRPSSRD